MLGSRHHWSCYTIPPSRIDRICGITGYKYEFSGKLQWAPQRTLRPQSPVTFDQEGGEAEVGGGAIVF